MSTNYIVIPSKNFLKMYGKLTKVEQKQVSEKILLLEEDPFYPALRSKKLRGRDDLYEFSVNMDIRVVWRYRLGRVILLFKVGHHDILKEYQ